MAPRGSSIGRPSARVRRAIGAAAALVGAASLVAASVWAPPWDPQLADLAHHVEQARGHAFRHTVPVRFLTAEAYRDHVAALGPVDEADHARALEQYAGQLRAMGVLGGGIDLGASLDALMDEGTLAVYDLDRKEIVVRGTTMTDELRATLVHELTHALQDQVHQLGDLIEFAPSNQVVSGLRAVSEGEADEVEYEWISQQPADTQDEIFRVRDEGYAAVAASLDQVPSILAAESVLPYQLGGVFVGLTVHGAGLTIDELYADPPWIDEHLLDPFTYLEVEDGVFLDLPSLPKGAAVVHEGDLGAVTLYLMLASRISPGVALEAALGWEGDAYRVYEGDDGVCFAVDVRVEDLFAATQLHEALEGWADGHGGSPQIERVDHVVELSACDPGAGATAPTHSALDALQYPVARTYLLSELQLFEGMPPGPARCVASRYFRTVDHDAFLRDHVDGLLDDVERHREPCAASGTT